MFTPDHCHIQDIYHPAHRPPQRMCGLRNRDVSAQFTMKGDALILVCMTRRVKVADYPQLAPVSCVGQPRAGLYRVQRLTCRLHARIGKWTDASEVGARLDSLFSLFIPSTSISQLHFQLFRGLHLQRSTLQPRYQHVCTLCRCQSLQSVSQR